MKLSLSKAGSAVMLAVVGVMVMAQSAMAAADPAVGGGVSDATGTLKDTIVAAVPLILAVVVVWVVLGLGKRLVKKAA
jgi:hypothetical protein